MVYFTYQKEKEIHKMKELYWYVVLYKNDKVLPIRFNSRETADEYIFKHKLKAYITIK